MQTVAQLGDKSQCTGMTGGLRSVSNQSVFYNNFLKKELE